MCGPAALPIAAIAVSIGSAATGALAANAQSRFQAKIAERNAGMEREAAQQDQQNTRDAALAQYRQVAQVRGAQRARAAGGVSVDMGTAQWVQDDTQMLGREDVNRIYRQGYETVRGRDIAASNYMGEAAAQRTAGKMALVKGGFDIGSSLLGSAQQFKDMKTPKVYDRGYDGIY